MWSLAKGMPVLVLMFAGQAMILPGHEPEGTETPRCRGIVPAMPRYRITHRESLDPHGPMGACALDLLPSLPDIYGAR
jgi:hypothetical protein